MVTSKQVWTIGHSTKTSSEFLEMLRSFKIEALVDIRTFPGSRRYPHFNKEKLSEILKVDGISYTHMAELGGRRKPKPDSVNTIWRNAGFRGYADYMQTTSFSKAMESLESLALTSRLAYMCAESLWWKCHRALLSDYLKAKGWAVCHIMGPGKCVEHPYTSPARSLQGKLFQ